MDISYQRRRGSIPLFAWHGVDNYGDRLGPALFHLVTKKPVYIEARGLQLVFDQGEPRTIHCFLGTLAHLLSGPHHFVLWGFGTAPPNGPAHHGCRPLTRDLDLDIRALRGPLTRDALIDAGYEVPEPVPFGDPGLLAPGFYSASPHRVDDFCVIPHHAHYREWREALIGMNVVDLNLASYEGLQGLILEITKYRVVFSASLHATILAESFGIPVRPIAPTLPFKFDDFYASVGKKGNYIPQMRRDLAWGRLYSETVEEWRPAVWDPGPWLDSSPFPIDEPLRRRLSDHYTRLAETNDPGPKSLPASTLATYRRIATDNSSAAGGPESSPELNERCLLCEDFRKAPDRWCLAIDGQTLQFLGDSEPAQIVEGGCEMTAKSSGVHLVTDYAEAGEAVEIRARVEFSAGEGLTELSLQDEKFRTIAHRLVGPNVEGKSWEMVFWPVYPNSRVRLVVSPLRGRLVIRQISVVGLYEPAPGSSEDEEAN